MHNSQELWAAYYKLTRAMSSETFKHLPVLEQMRLEKQRDELKRLAKAKEARCGSK